MVSKSLPFTKPEDDPIDGAELAKGKMWLSRAMAKVAAIESDIREKQLKVLQRVPQRADFDSVIDEAGVPSEADRTEDLHILEQHKVSLEHTIEANKQNLDLLLGRISIRALRPDHLENEKDCIEILEAIQTVCAASERMKQRRSNRERQGFKTGSLPNTQFPGAVWPMDDVYGGGAFTAYYRYVCDCYPAIKRLFEGGKRAVAG